MFDNNSNIDVGRWRRKRFLTKSLFVVVARFDDETFLMKGGRSDVAAHVFTIQIVVYITDDHYSTKLLRPNITSN